MNKNDEVVELPDVGYVPWNNKTPYRLYTTSIHSRWCLRLLCL